MLTFNLKKEWFEKIKSGEKTHEYREEKYYWTSKIVKELFNPKNKKEHKHLIELFLTMLRIDFHYKCLEFHKICFMNGMISEETKPRIYAIMKSIRIVNGLNTDLKIDKNVFDIEFELIEDSNE